MSEEKRRLLSKVVEYYLEDYDFEEFLEMFDLTPAQVFECAYNSGLVDEQLFENFLSSDS